ncbi:MAG: hypothetical protein M1819_005876 [Sarea resinae]|nr:MAG: hypothetical protein M1819_005876 [Sarea resinae]
MVLGKVKFPSASVSDNFTSASITQLPVNILEAFIPGYSFISKFLLEVLGFDVTIIVSICLLIFAIGTSAGYLWKHAYNLFSKWFMSSISISNDDDIYVHLMRWLAEHSVSKDSRSLIAKSQRGSWDINEEEPDEGELDNTTMFNFSNWDAKTPPMFEPYFGQHYFWHQGRLFLLNREAKQVLMTGYNSRMRDDETLRLTCIGRSAEPIKRLLMEARDRYLNKQKSLTIIRRAAPKETRHQRSNIWTRVAVRPSRPIETVVLDHEQKSRVLLDINEYLHPATRRWYANRGIPYRRGYLFHGPPGTGKTSLSFAIAGIFGLDIFVISLLEPTLTEEDLGMLFNNLPRRCVVLLEDIDSAGLARKDKSDDDAASNKAPAEWGLVEVAKALRKENDEKDAKNKGISLSGLLNAIDGVASHEGRVLVMTTNFPDKLDDALIRPGRVDMQVTFTLASKIQIRELFVRMYESDRKKGVDPTKTTSYTIQGQPSKTVTAPSVETRSPVPPTHASQTNGHAKQPSNAATNVDKPTTVHATFATDSLQLLADEFAAHLPDATFTPAEIQGFLLTRKKEPAKAVREVESWRDSVLEAKRARVKVLAGGV